MHVVVSAVTRLVQQTYNMKDSLLRTFCIIDMSQILQAKFMMYIISTKCHTECGAVQEMQYVSIRYDTGCRYVHSVQLLKLYQYPVLHSLYSMYMTYSV